jgi:hypothetical protein
VNVQGVTYTPAPPTFVVGLDLGLAADYSALAVVECSETPEGETSYGIVHLHRWALNTNYFAIAKDVAELAYRRELGRPRLAADKTGCGGPVCEILAKALDAADDGRGDPVVLSPIVITGGRNWTRGPDGYHVAKVELVSVVNALLSSDRLDIAPQLPLAVTLAAELRNFRVKITASQNETFESWREKDHDDLLLAAALGLWLADRGPRPCIEAPGGGGARCW